MKRNSVPLNRYLEETVQNVPKKKAIEGHNVFLEEILSLVDAKADGKIWSNGGFQGPKATCSHSQALLVGTKNRVHSLLGHVATFITLLSEYSPWHNNPPSRITTWESTSTCLFEEIHCIIVQKPQRNRNDVTCTAKKGLSGRACPRPFGRPFFSLSCYRAVSILLLDFRRKIH